MNTTDTFDALTWFREARFGMMIHWGVYAVPAGSWQGEGRDGIGEWLMGALKIPLAEYRQLTKQFNPTAFDADAIVALAKAAGMKYIVITAKHHDGFAMWDSKVSDYNIVRATPYGKDPLQQLARACVAGGIKLGFYYSQDLDWEHPDGTFNTWDYDPAKKDFGRYLEQKVKPQLRELLTNYGPICLIWCDTPITINYEQAADLRRFIKALQPGCLINGRLGHDLGDYGTLGDNVIPLRRLSGEWETPATLNGTWGYKKQDQNWKSTATLLRLLIELASKGANYLLNIGPTGKGEVPAESITRLREIGAWLQKNGAAIYGTQASPFANDFPWGRITQRANKLYLILTNRTTGSIALNGLRSPVQSARFLTSGEVVEFSEHHDLANDDHRLELKLPPLELAEPRVIEVTVRGEMDVDGTLIEQAHGEIGLLAPLATLHVEPSKPPRHPASATGEPVAERVEAANEAQPQHLSLMPNGLLRNWFHTDDWLEWEFRVIHPGEFRVRVQTVAQKYKPWAGGHQVRVETNGQKLSGEIRADEMLTGPRTDHFAEAATDLGRVRFPHAGRYRLTLHASAINAAIPTGLCVSEVRLVATQSSR